MTPHEFKAKWNTPSGNERQTYQAHIREFCARAPPVNLRRGPTATEGPIRSTPWLHRIFNQLDNNLRELTFSMFCKDASKPAN